MEAYEAAPSPNPNPNRNPAPNPNQLLDDNFGRWFDGRSPPRKATDADCKFACTHDKHTWCVGYEFIASEKGTCRLFDDCKTSAAELNGTPDPELSGLRANVGFRRRDPAGGVNQRIPGAAAAAAEAAEAAAVRRRALGAEAAEEAAELAAAAAEGAAQRARAARAFRADMARHGLADGVVTSGHGLADAAPPRRPAAALPFIALSDGGPDS